MYVGIILALDIAGCGYVSISFKSAMVPAKYLLCFNLSEGAAEFFLPLSFCLAWLFCMTSRIGELTDC